MNEPTEFTFTEATLTPLGGGESVVVGAGTGSYYVNDEETQRVFAGIREYVQTVWNRVVVSFEASMTPEMMAWLEAVIAEHEASAEGIDVWEGEGGSWH